MRNVVLGIMLAAGLSGCTNVTTRETADQPWTWHPAVVPFAKVARGTKNIALAPLDVPATIIRKEASAQGIGGHILALPEGAVEGMTNGGIRMVAGAGEVMSFMFLDQPQPMYQRDLGEPALR